MINTSNDKEYRNTLFSLSTMLSTEVIFGMSKFSKLFTKNLSFNKGNGIEKITISKLYKNDHRNSSVVTNYS